MEKKQQNCKASMFLQNWSTSLILLLSFLPFSHPFDYKDALSKSILYFESQRSGPLPDNQRATWRYHSGLTDGLQEGVDLVGGYYDAGDNVKFGFPMAFTITMLSWSVIEYIKQIESAGEYQHALEAIKWGTDYLIKAHPEPHLLWAQVGDGLSDHKCWQRPEDMTTSRKAYFIDEQRPGSDLAGETAAAFAASSIVFRTINPPYSQILLEHAEQLFEFADKFRGTYDKSVKAAKGFYTSWSGYKDELLWAAMWLYKATEKYKYLVYVTQNAAKLGGTSWFGKQFSWDVKMPGAQILASMLPNTTHDRIFKRYRSAAEHYVCANLNKNSIKKTNVAQTEGGYIFIHKWNNIQYAINAAFLLGVYSDHLATTNRKIVCSNGDSVGPNELLQLSKSQVDYILGSNPMNMSYLVGFGPNYPKKVHHRGASIVSYRHDKTSVECHQGYKAWFKREGPNPNVVVGAVVGGPDINDQFRDERNNYMQTEACMYNNSPLVGILAKFYGVQQETSIYVER